MPPPHKDDSASCVHSSGSTHTGFNHSAYHAMQGAEAKDADSTSELTLLRSDLEAYRAKAEGHSRALQELSAQAQASLYPLHLKLMP